nr:hypothetical protein [Tanacetum cinerariifolium]
MEIELPENLKYIPNILETFTSTVSSLPPRIATIMENASPKATDKSVSLAGQADKGKEVMTSKDAEEEETECDSEDDHANLANSMVETSKQNKLKKFSFVIEGGEQIRLTTEKTKEQKRIAESLKAELAKQEVEKVKNELVNLIGTI